MSWLLLAFACAPRFYEVHMDTQPSKNSHYVLVRSSMGNSMVYDCLSHPDGKTWDPTCVKARMLQDPPRDEKQRDGKEHDAKPNEAR